MKTVALAYLGIAISQARSVSAQLTLERIFRPFEWLDLSFLYNRYGVIIDLFIYSLIFVGAAQASLGRRYPGRGGRAMTVGVGLALAIGMILAEQRYGFSIKSFGPVAALVLLFLVGVMLFRLLHHSGVSLSRSAAAAYVIIFLILLGVAPEFSHWLEEAAPLVGLASLILFLACLAILLTPPGFGSGRGMVSRALGRRPNNDDLGRRLDRGATKAEKRIIRRQLRPRSKKMFADAHNISAGIDAVENEIQQHGRDTKKTPTIIEELRRLTAQVEKLRGATAELQRVSERVRDLERDLWARKKSERNTAAGKKEKVFLNEELKDERSRLNAEGKTSQFEEALERNVTAMSRCLYNAAAALKQRRIKEALQYVQQAKVAQRSIEKLLHLIRKFEDYLLHLVKKDVRIENKQKAM